MVVNRSDVVRDVHIAVVVVVIRVYVRGVRHAVSVVRAVVSVVTRSVLVVTGVAVAFIARTADRLRLCMTFCSISAFDGGVGSVGRRGDGVGIGSNRSVAGTSRAAGIRILSC